MPYVFALTGLGFGTVLIILGALLSHYSSSLIIRCNMMTGLKTYGDFAQVAFNGSKLMRNLVSICIMISLLGFTTAYISLAKTLIPSIIAYSLTDERYAAMPYCLQNNETGRLVFATIFTFVVLLPMACFRELSMLRYTSFFGVFCSVILMFALIYEFVENEEVVP